VGAVRRTSAIVSHTHSAGPVGKYAFDG
jgi:hypothetical protein